MSKAFSGEKSNHREGLHLLPEHMHEEIIAWCETPDVAKLSPFLHALLRNDFGGALALADERNVAAIAKWAIFLREHAPAGSYGSAEQVRRWHIAGFQKLAPEKSEEIERNRIAHEKERIERIGEERGQKSN